MTKNRGFLALRVQMDCWKFILRQNSIAYGLNYIYQTNLLCHRSFTPSEMFFSALKCQKFVKNRQKSGFFALRMRNNQFWWFRPLELLQLCKILFEPLDLSIFFMILFFLRINIFFKNETWSHLSPRHNFGGSKFKKVTPIRCRRGFKEHFAQSR